MSIDWDKEPAVISGSVAGLLGLAAAFGLHFTDQQVGAIVAAAAAVVTVIGSFVVRKTVTSPATVQAQRAGAADLLRRASSADVPSAARARLCPGVTSDTDAPVRPAKALGRRPPSNKPALRFAEHVAQVPAHPITDLPPKLNWPMDHNDTVGCCVVAGFDHFRQVVETSLIGSYQPWTDAQLLALYQTQNPDFKKWSQGGKAADGGMVIQDFLNYLVKQGIILGFAKVDHTNLDEIRAATYLGLGVVTGEILTTKNLSEQVWDYHSGDPVEGGHCTVSVGYNPLEEQVSWGALYSMTDAFFAKRVEEAWFVITQAHVDHPAFRQGFDLAGFAAAYKQLTGRDFPVPVTPAPSPVPVPPAPGGDDPFQVAVAAYAGLDTVLARRAAAKHMSEPQYAAWYLAGETHTR